MKDVIVSVEKTLPKGVAPNVVEPDRGKWEWVPFPDVDIFDKPHQPVSINGIKFERGNRYFMPPDWATELRKLLATGHRADMRLMQSTPDVRSVNQAPSQNPQTTFVRS